MDLAAWKLEKHIHAEFGKTMSNELSLNAMLDAEHADKSLASLTFFKVLVLASGGALKVAQDEPMGGIRLIRAPNSEDDDSPLEH